ncbi:MAG: hypothetical protein ACYCZY_09105 [Lacisediminihabitans sp.]
MGNTTPAATIKSPPAVFPTAGSTVGVAMGDGSTGVGLADAAPVARLVAESTPVCIPVESPAREGRAPGEVIMNGNTNSRMTPAAAGPTLTQK